MTGVIGGTVRNSVLAPIAAGATSGSLFAATLWVPLGFLLSLASPLPVAIEAWRRGTLAAAIAIAVGAAAAGILGGLLGSVVYLSQFALGGLALGLATRAERPPTQVVGGYALVTTAAVWLPLLWMALRSGLGVAGFLGASVDQMLEPFREQLLQQELDAQATLALQSLMEQTRSVTVRLFPGLFGALAILTGWGNALALRRVMGSAAGAAWNRWSAPESWIWILIGSGLLAALVPGTAGTAALNVLLVALTVYLLQGLAITQFLFEAKNFPRVFRGAAYALLFFQPPVMLLVAGVGAFDLWFDFRSRLEPPPDGTGGGNQ